MESITSQEVLKGIRDIKLEMAHFRYEMLETLKALEERQKSCIRDIHEYLRRVLPPAQLQSPYHPHVYDPAHGLTHQFPTSETPVMTIQHQRMPVPKPPSKTVRKKEHFDDVGMPMDQFFDILMELRLIEPLDHYVHPQRPNIDSSKFCKYHKCLGHDTDKCLQLKRAVQRLIDQGLVQGLIDMGIVILNGNA